MEKKKKNQYTQQPWMLREHVLLLTKLCLREDPQQHLKENSNFVPVWLEHTDKFEAVTQNKQALIN